MRTFGLALNETDSQFLKEQLDSDETYKLLEVEITAESFLYKMIRKMVGVAVDVARHLRPLEQINRMMLCPPDFYGPSSTTILKPNGLFLKKVHY